MNAGGALPSEEYDRLLESRNNWRRLELSHHETIDKLEAQVVELRETLRSLIAVARFHASPELAQRIRAAFDNEGKQS